MDTPIFAELAQLHSIDPIPVFADDHQVTPVDPGWFLSLDDVDSRLIRDNGGPA